MAGTLRVVAIKRYPSPPPAGGLIMDNQWTKLYSAPRAPNSIHKAVWQGE